MHHLTPMDVVAKSMEKTVSISLDWKRLPSQCCNDCLCCCSWHRILNLSLYRYNMLYSTVLDLVHVHFIPLFVVPESSLCPVVHLSANKTEQIRNLPSLCIVALCNPDHQTWAYHVRQNLHTPQFSCKQSAHTPHCFFLFFPEGLGNCFNLPVYIFYHLPVYNFYQC